MFSWGLFTARILCYILYLCALHVSAWARTAAPVPPMGWSTWTTFKCNINETLILESIKALSDPVKGLSNAGYDFVMIDDCWAAPRNASGAIQVDKGRFPRGFGPVVEAAHSRNLKIGIYTAVGETTCAGMVVLHALVIILFECTKYMSKSVLKLNKGFTGSFGHEAQDAATFHAWGFDFVKHVRAMPANI